MITKKELEAKYFDWMIQLIRNKDTYRYKQLLSLLRETTFIYTMTMDDNRYADGLELRYRFAENTGIDYMVINKYYNSDKCSVLEMMVALSLRCEEDIMGDTIEGNRIPLWFWTMVNSLGLGSMMDKEFDRQYSLSKLFIFLNRDYNSNGRGGLFTVRSNKQDMRNVEIWYQACIYLNEFIARKEK